MDTRPTKNGSRKDQIYLQSGKRAECKCVRPPGQQKPELLQALHALSNSFSTGIPPCQRQPKASHRGLNFPNILLQHTICHSESDHIHSAGQYSTIQTIILLIYAATTSPHRPQAPWFNHLPHLNWTRFTLPGTRGCTQTIQKYALDADKQTNDSGDSDPSADATTTQAQVANSTSGNSEKSTLLLASNAFQYQGRPKPPIQRAYSIVQVACNVFTDTLQHVNEVQRHPSPSLRPQPLARSNNYNNKRSWVNPSSIITAL